MASDEAMRLHERRARAAAEYKTVLNEAEGRAFTADERTKLNTMDEELSNLDKQIKSVLDIDKRGQEADLRVRGGDVIVVEKSVAGAVPYSVYFLLNKLYLGVPY